MNVVTKEINIDRSPEVAFKVWTEEIDAWWPFEGKYRYTFAGPDRQPDRILFEPELGGRFYEVFANGEEYTIGTISEFGPPHRLVYTWQDPDWTAATTIEVTFTPEGEGTRVKVVHSGWEEVGAGEMAVGYHEGYDDILAAFTKGVTGA